MGNLLVFLRELGYATAPYGLMYLAGLFSWPIYYYVKRKLLKRRVDETFYAVRKAVEPDTLSNPDETNHAYMKSEARDAVNLLLPRLQAARLPPPPESATRENLSVWFDYLGSIRGEL